MIDDIKEQPEEERADPGADPAGAALAEAIYRQEESEPGRVSLFGMLDAGQGETATPIMVEHQDDGGYPYVEITAISYRLLQSTPNYGHHAIEVTANVNDDDPNEVLRLLKEWVGARIGGEIEAGDLKDGIRQLERKKRELVEDIATMQTRWDRMREAMIKLGIDPKTVHDLFNDVPF